MSQPRWQIILGLILLTIIAAVVVGLLTFIFRKVAALDQPLIVAIIAAAVTIITSTITVVVGRFLERKKEIEAHFRQKKYDQYDELLKILYEFFDEQNSEDPSEVNVRRLRDWQRNLILFSGPKAIHAFVVWMEHLKNGSPTVRTVLLMEDFFKALRKDLGVSNQGLELGDFSALILRNPRLVIAMARSNPDMPLDELGKLENAFVLGNENQNEAKRT